MQQHRTAPPATLEAVLEPITYANEQTGYTVARVADLVVGIVANRLPRRFGLDPGPRGAGAVPDAPGAGVGSKRALAKQSTPKAPDVATPPSPNGYDPGGRLPSQQPARQPQQNPVEPAQRRWAGSVRQDGQGEAQATQHLHSPGVRGQGA
jgi:hypothetical protein